jgi:hypothetical protein
VPAHGLEPLDQRGVGEVVIAVPLFPVSCH